MQKIKDPYNFKKKIISGVPIYYKNLPWSPCIHIGIGFKVGAYDDPVGQEGLAHFLEHLGFNGTKLYPNKEKIREFSKKYALDSFNAHTGFWETEFTAKCLPKNFEKVFEAVWDIVYNPLLDRKETEHERSIILQESWGLFRNEKYKNYLKEYTKNIKPGLEHNRIYSPIGWPETIQKIKHDSILDFHNKKYSKNNMYIVLAGAVDDNDLKLIKQFIPLENTKEKKKSIKKIQIIPLPKIKSKVFLSENIGSKQDHATYSIAIEIPRNVKNEMILTMSQKLLHAILFEVLREEMGLSYSIQVGCYVLVDHLHNYISLDLDQTKIKEAEKKIFEILDDIKKEKYKNKFFDEKQLLIDEVLASERTADHIIRDASHKIIYYGQTISLTKRIADLKRVTYKEVAKYIGDTFEKKKVYVEVILP